MSTTTSKIRKSTTKALQDIGLVAKPTFAQAVTQTVADAGRNATLAIGTVGMAGVKAGAKRTGKTAKSVRTSKAAGDVKRAAVKTRNITTPVVATAASAVAVQLLIDVLTQGVRKGAKAAASTAVSRSNSISASGSPAAPKLFRKSA